jgi:XXXCH domain-containing protein
MQEGKFEATLSVDELVNFFRDLAEGLEGGGEVGGDGFGLSLAEFEKLKVSVKKQEQEYVLKLKVKSPDQELEAEELAREEEAGEAEVEEGEEDIRQFIAEGKKIKYKTLKKRMKKTWESILDSASKDNIPPEDATKSFIDDSALMVTYTKKDKGPEYYEEYVRATEAFREAYEEGNMQQLKLAVEELERIKKNCHSEYK